MTDPAIGDLISLCGLSHVEAAEYPDVHVGTIRKWTSGQRRTPPRVILELAALWKRISSVEEPVLALPDGARRVRELLRALRDGALPDAADDHVTAPSA